MNIVSVTLPPLGPTFYRFFYAGPRHVFKSVGAGVLVFSSVTAPRILTPPLNTKLRTERKQSYYSSFKS